MYISVAGSLWLEARYPPKRSVTHLLSWIGDRKYNKKLESWDRGRERSHISYHHGQNKLDLGKINLLPIKNRFGCWETKRKSKTLFPTPSFSQVFYFILLTLIPPPCPVVQGNGGCGQSVTIPLCWSFLLTLFGCSSVGPSHWQQSVKCSNMGPLRRLSGKHASVWAVHGPQFFMGNTACMGALPWAAVWVFVLLWSSPWAAGDFPLWCLEYLLSLILFWPWCLQVF